VTDCIAKTPCFAHARFDSVSDYNSTLVYIF